MVEKTLLKYAYAIDEDIVPESLGFVQKLMSTNEKIITEVEKASKALGKELDKIDKVKLEEADEKLKPLLKVFAENKDKIEFNYDVFENGVIRIFETEDEEVAKQLQDASASMNTTEEEKAKSESEKPAEMEEEAEEIEEWDPEKERLESEREARESLEAEKEKAEEEAKETAEKETIYLHVDTITKTILESEKPVMVFYINPDKEESKELIEKLPEYTQKFLEVKVKAVDVGESAELDEILKITPAETPIVVLYTKDEDQIKELARLQSSLLTEGNLEAMAKQ